jgi:hypothetical protein
LFKSRSHKEIADHFTYYLELVILKHVNKDIKSNTGSNAHIDDKNFRAIEEAETQKRVRCHHQFDEASVQYFMSLIVELLLMKELP